MKLSFKAIMPLLIFVGLVIAFGLGLTRDPSLIPSQLIDRAFPNFRLTELLDKEKVLDETILGDEISLVNVFGSWCVACEYEHEMLIQISKSGRVQLVGINWRDTREKGAMWLERLGNPYHHIVFDAGSTLVIPLGVTGAPESFLVDQNGRIRYKYVGPITPQIWRDEFLPIIENLETGTNLDLQIEAK